MVNITFMASVYITKMFLVSLKSVDFFYFKLQKFRCYSSVLISFPVMMIERFDTT